VPRRLPDQGVAELAGGFLPGVYQGTYIDTQHSGGGKLIENIRNRTAARPCSGGSSTCCSS
jgi:hypothetical protein